MARNEPQVNLRMPEELKNSLEAAAVASNRSLTSEIVARLQQSFTPAVQSGEIEAIAAERDQQRALAEQFRSIADSTESLRALLAAMLLRAFEKMRLHSVPVDTDVWLQETFLRWLTEKDVRGAAFSILRLIDESSPEVVETLRNFTSHLEDLGLVRKPIELIKAGAGGKPKRAGRAVNKVILVGKSGVDHEVRYLNINPPQNNKGPIRRTRNKPPK